jgi:phosphatidylglycerophosphate synthase
MFDAAFRKLIDPPLDRVGRMLARTGVTANMLTVSGLVIGLGVVPALAAQQYALALSLIGINRILDGLDGAVARAVGPTDLGGYLDIVADFIFYSAVIFGFALGQPQDAIWAAFLIFSFVGTGSSFLAYAIIAAKRGLSTEARGSKSIFYLGGLAEGSETIALLVVVAICPQYFAVLAGIFGTMCWITTASRVGQAIHEFK